jgi:hypothetical protein
MLKGTPQLRKHPVLLYEQVMKIFIHENEGCCTSRRRVIQKKNKFLVHNILIFFNFNGGFVTTATFLYLVMLMQLLQFLILIGPSPMNKMTI